MKIIAKHKDFYDYLPSFYGVDPKLVLVRKKEFNIGKPSEGEIITFIIGGKLIQFYYKNGQYHTGESIKEFDHSSKWWFKDGFFRIEIGDSHRTPYGFISNGIKDGYDYLNEEYNSPILYHRAYWHYEDFNEMKFKEFPILFSTPIPSFYSPEEVYNWIAGYLARQVDKAQDQPTSLTNNERIISKGFDLKTSFRPNIK